MRKVGHFLTPVWSGRAAAISALESSPSRQFDDIGSRPELDIQFETVGTGMRSEPDQTGSHTGQSNVRCDR